MGKVEIISEGVVGDVAVTGAVPREGRSTRKFLEADPPLSQAVGDEFVLAAITPSLA